MTTDRDPYSADWELHPTIEQEQAEQEARHWAHHWSLEAIPIEGPDTTHCRDCGAPLDVEDQPLTACEACLPAAMARDPWPWPLPQERP